MRLTHNHLRLYDLIFRRFIASQLSEAEVKFYTYVASINTLERVIEVPVSILRDGFLKIYNNLIVLPSLENVDEVVVKPGDVRVVRGSEVKLLTVSDVVKLMKDRGIGRPSTYAKAVDNNVRHGYLIISKKRLCLIPTKLGVEVYDLLSKYLPDITSEVMTREVEGLLDAVRDNLLNRDEALTLLLGDVVGIRLRSDLLLSNAREDLTIN
jgi:reverse gyrase